MQIKVKKGAGNTVGYVLKRLSVSLAYSLQPIGFRLDEESNIVFSNVVVEDLVTFLGHLTDYQFKLKKEPSVEEAESGENNFYSVSVSGTTIKASDLNNESVQIELDDKGDRILLTATQDIHLTVYFRYGKGVYNIESNSEFLSDHLKVFTEMNTFASIHNGCKYLTWELEELPDCDLLKINTDKPEIVEQSIRIAQQIFTQISLD